MTKKKADRDDEEFIFDKAQPVDAVENKLLDEDGTIVKAPAKDEERLPEFGGKIIGEDQVIVCEGCDDRGAVPKTIINGVVTEWKDCALCYRYELKDKNGVIRLDEKGNPFEVRRLRSVVYDD